MFDIKNAKAQPSLVNLAFGVDGTSQFKVMLLISVYLCLFIVLLDHFCNTKTLQRSVIVASFIFPIPRITPFVKLSPVVSETFRIRKRFINFGYPPNSTVLN